MVNMNKIEDYSYVSKLLPSHQAKIVRNSLELMQMMPELETDLAQIPALYSQDGLRMNTVVFAHYFHCSSDLYITEVDIEENLAYGFTVLHGDITFAEFGYLSLEDFRNSNVELDFHWNPIALSEALKAKGYEDYVSYKLAS